MTYLLLDNNLSRKIPAQVRKLYLDIHHVHDASLQAEDDRQVWEYVRVRSGAIITKDSDFNHLLNRFGHPPKVIWLRTGNTTTQRIIQLLVDRVNQINDFLNNSTLGMLELY